MQQDTSNPSTLQPARARQRANFNTPEIQAYRRDVRDFTFVRQGMMVAFPTCFPGITVPIPLDESRITALAAAPEGTIYGGTGGAQTHLFAAEFHGLTGLVFDLGTVPGATECVAVCCGLRQYAGFVNGPRGGRAILSRMARLDADCIQEWGFNRPPLEDLGECVAGEPVVHAVAATGSHVVGATTKHVFTLDLDGKKIETVGEAAAGGRLTVAKSGAVSGRDGDGHLWSFDPKTAKFTPRAAALPSGDWSQPLRWAKGPDGIRYTTDSSGQIYSFSETSGFSAPLAKAPLTPVGPMAVTIDRRMFGFCGAQMAKMFLFDTKTHEFALLGVAASVIQRRRYGYIFSDAVLGRDGEVVFGENDNGGHVWLYFPKLLPRA